MIDVLDKPTSVIYAALQYLSYLLHGQPRRLLLLWRPSREASFEEWFAAHPAQVRQLRRVVLLVSASIYRRHVKALWSFPWLLVFMVDTRVSQADREEMTEQYDQKGSCCLPGGFARKLKVRGKTGKDLCHVQVPNPWGGGWFVLHQSISGI